MEMDRLTDWAYIRRLLLALGVAGLLVAGVAVGADMPQVAHYLLLHNVLEVAAVAVAAMVFAVGWNVRRLQWKDGAFLLAVGFLGVGLLDFAHAMSFVGMPDYVTPNSVNKAIHFWLAARYVGAVTLLVVAWMPLQTVPHAGQGWFRSLPVRWGMLLGMLALVGLFHVWFLWYPHTLPAMFEVGEGLTPIKKAAELGVIVLLLLAAGLLYRRLDLTQHLNVPMLMGAAVVMAMSEVFFSFYLGPTDVFNLLGHVYKVIAYWMLYQSVFVTTVTQPYRALNESRQHLQAVLDAVPDLMFEMDLQGRYLQVYAQRKELLAAPEATLLGKTVHEVLPAPAAQDVMDALEEARTQGGLMAASSSCPWRTTKATGLNYR